MLFNVFKRGRKTEVRRQGWEKDSDMETLSLKFICLNGASIHYDRNFFRFLDPFLPVCIGANLQH